MNRNVARSSHLAMLEENCPWAVKLRLDGEQGLTEVYEVGVAAHDVAQGISLGQDIDALCLRLTTEGRQGYDTGGPLHISNVQEGRRLAERWDLDTGIQIHDPDQESWAELGFGYSSDWKPEPYAEASYFNTRIDHVSKYQSVDDFFGEILVLSGMDYKTAWPDTESALSSLQRKMQAVAMYRSVLADDVDVIEVQIGNFRTLGTYTKRFFLDNPDDVVELEEWAAEVELACETYHRAMIDPKPIPGPRCIGCKHYDWCEHRDPNMSTDTIPLGENIGLLRAKIEADVRKLRVLLEDRPHLVVQGKLVGYRTVEKAVVADDALQILLARWNGDKELTVDAVVGLLLAGGGLGVTQVRKMIRALKLNRDERIALTNRCLPTHPTSKWFVGGALPPENNND